MYTTKRILNNTFMASIVGLVMMIIYQSCKLKEQPVIVTQENYIHSSIEDVKAFKKLSEYRKFDMPLAAMKPIEGVIPYDLNSSLFTDYAFKKRFIFLPEGTSMTYHEEKAFDFPEGSLIFKFFYYPSDFRQPDANLQLIETRVLIRENNDWTALTYIWDESQTDAHLALAGDSKQVAWMNESGVQQSVNYSIPNVIQCKSCHEYNGKMAPIGPAARHMNKIFSFDNAPINQLDRMISLGILKGIKSAALCPKIPDYKDTKASLEQRARAYLDINCAHCHRPEGPAKNSALNLLSSEKNPVAYGVMKTPIAAGIGSGGLKYDIVPGNHEKSILYYRINSLYPGIAMPEIGRKMNHKEGLDLVKDWIAQME